MWRREYVARPTRARCTEGEHPANLRNAISRLLPQATFTILPGVGPWIPERSATLLRKADLNVLSKLGNQGLE